jgi:hypothetical protein
MGALRQRGIPFVIASSLAILLSGCIAPRVTEEQVARAARDWCMTIRASQVLPVYPLTEDVLPGDIFLVRRPIQDEQDEYKARGFLPLPQLIVRLHPRGIDDFYLSSHGTKGRTDPPYFWRFDGPGVEMNKLALMPRAGFPTYNFSTRRGAGLNVAIPVQGIPVAMNLVGSSQVEGTVLLKDAYTYGLDQVNLQNQLLDWASGNAPFLNQLAPAAGSTNYLRMVSRIYLVGGVNVQVNSAASGSGSVSGGADKPVNLPNLSGTNTVESYNNALSALSSSLSTALNAPGGTLKVAAASSRSVSLDEKFPRPLVVGYLGFDIAILHNGKLGLPRDTLLKLKGAKAGASGELIYAYGADGNTAILREWLRTDPTHPRLAQEWLNQQYGSLNLANVLTAQELRDVRGRMVRELVKPQDH